MIFVYFLELWVELGVLSHASLRKKLGFGSTKAFFWRNDFDLGIGWRSIL
jgi:hypothetical protein